MIEKIYVLILEDRVTEEVSFSTSYKSYYNPIDEYLKCIKDEDIKEIRSIGEIEYDGDYDNYDDIYRIRYREIKSVYDIKSGELTEYISKNNDLQVSNMSYFELLRDILNIKDMNYDKYEKMIKKENRSLKIKSILNKIYGKK